MSRVYWFGFEVVVGVLGAAATLLTVGGPTYHLLDNVAAVSVGYLIAVLASKLALRGPLSLREVD